ncbi:putative alcohol dehydrogenase [Aspergillus nomiae NRRL 13137]|uniref:Putative alcohol dehydrogenase n=1 Tax=Aspergillus nomiae NRRL (strain ATCC 15546 / NRRL 13137 / CBS 260.88 / M93) TaxID=1509407 RepID=A0A0L1J395_ASPN3|nr:putative alcohol dehydrogenase [Aspergillus nomiae NRRL 13137]KNG86135.1 putative alcohol dehydrogenase [Aspergillus nomiae NRRL 13137]
MGRLQGKTAIVTGGGSGFGEAIAHGFVAEGAHVIVADISVAGGERVVQEIRSKEYIHGGSAIFLQADVTKRGDWEKALSLAKTKFGKCDIVVNNAGTTYKKQPSAEVSEADFDRVVAINVKSIYLSSSVMLPYFVERGSGVFLSTSSVGAMRPRSGQVFYAGTKGFLNTVTQGLAAEYGPHGVRVNTICPLLAATNLLEMFTGVPDTPEGRAEFAKGVPLGRMSEPSDIANAAVFLASDAAGFITGVNFPVDGGRLTL